MSGAAASPPPDTAAAAAAAGIPLAPLPVPPPGWSWAALLWSLRRPFATWWTRTPALSKLFEVLIGLVTAPVVGVGLLAYAARGDIVTAFRERILNPEHQLAYEVIEAETPKFLDRVAIRGARGIAVLEVSTAGNQRKVLAWAAVPSHRAAMERVIERLSEGALVGDGTFSLETYRLLIEGRIAWEKSPVTTSERLIVPVPPSFGTRVIGIISIGVDPATAASDRVMLENIAQRWAATLYR